MGMNSVDPTFDLRLRLIYQSAMKKGLWKEKYAATNHHEYWAEGVQSCLPSRMSQVATLSLKR